MCSKAKPSFFQRVEYLYQSRILSTQVDTGQAICMYGQGVRPRSKTTLDNILSSLLVSFRKPFPFGFQTSGDQRETDLSSVFSEIHEERQMAITENYTKDDLIGGRWALHRELAVRRTSLSLIGLLVLLFISADCARGCTEKCTSEPYHDAPQSPESLRLTGRHLKSRQDLVVRIRY